MLNFTPLSLGRTSFRGSLFTAIFIAMALTFFSSCEAAREGKLTDSRNGKVYKTVKMPNGKVWLAENLNYAAEGSKCYDNKEENCQKYGRLYDWATAKTVCPSGWHLPSKEEWEGLPATKHLKAKDGWSENGNGMDAFGFAALPGGGGGSDGSFGNPGYYGSWWSASESNRFSAYYRFMYYSSEIVLWYGGNKINLLSVRCLQD